MDNITFHSDWGEKLDLVALLGLQPPPLQPPQAQNQAVPFRQLHYISQYVTELKCQTVVLEKSYTDRHHMEDHSTYYSKSFQSYPNSCRRLHFFTFDQESLSAAFRVVRNDCRTAESYRKECQKISECYLGFSVIRPLPGAPVGRTVLKCYPEYGEGKRRIYPSVHANTVHLLGTELSVNGIAFQQQDHAVSACATTAIWSSLHYLRGAENFPTATPAQITKLATNGGGTNGRAMPSAGLTPGQMCTALSALGVAPSLFSGNNKEVTLASIYAALQSEMAPILYLERWTESSGRVHNSVCVHHAVTVTGMKFKHPLPGPPPKGAFSLADHLLGFHLHDDVRGPYVTSEIDSDPAKRGLHLTLGRSTDNTVRWKVSHVLIPMYPKINLSLLELREVASQAEQILTPFVEGAVKRTARLDLQTFQSEYWFTRGHKYLQSLLHGDGRLTNPSQAEKILLDLSLPRYVGVIRLDSAFTGKIDILIDSTETAHHARCLAVIPHDPISLSARTAAKEIAAKLGAADRLIIG